MVSNLHLYPLMGSLRLFNYLVLLIAIEAPSSAFAQQAPTWAATSRLSVDQGFQKYSKAQSLNLFSGSFEIPSGLANTHSLETDLLHSYVWDEFADQHPNQILALDFSYGFSHKLSSRDESIFTSLDLGAPISDKDRISGFQGSVEAGLGYKNRIGIQSFGFSTYATTYSFALDTANTAGTVYNKKATLLLRGIYGLHFSKRFSWGSRADLDQYVNVIGTRHQEYYFSTGPSYAWTKTLSTYAKVITTDAIETYKTPLDEQITSARVGLEWSI